MVPTNLEFPLRSDNVNSSKFCHMRGTCPFDLWLVLNGKLSIWCGRFASGKMSSVRLSFFSFLCTRGTLERMLWGGVQGFPLGHHKILYLVVGTVVPFLSVPLWVLVWFDFGTIAVSVFVRWRSVVSLVVTGKYIRSVRSNLCGSMIRRFANSLVASQL